MNPGCQPRLSGVLFVQKSSLIIALLTIVLGVVIMLASFGLFPVEDESFTAPRWVVSLAGGAFLVSGVLLLLTLQRRAEFGLAVQEPAVKVFIRGGFTVLLLAIFAVLSHWVAFGSGGTTFDKENSMPLLAFSSSANGVVGRLGFISGALLIDGLLVLGVIDLVHRVLRWRSKPKHEK
jgi:hypothetical protein